MMPSSPDKDLEQLENKVKELSDKNEAQNYRIEREPIAFGLNALVLTFLWPEEKELEPFENELKQIEGLNSAEVIDMRRAVG